MAGPGGSGCRHAGRGVRGLSTEAGTNTGRGRCSGQGYLGADPARVLCREGGKSEGRTRQVEGRGSSRGAAAGRPGGAARRGSASPLGLFLPWLALFSPGLEVHACVHLPGRPEVTTPETLGTTETRHLRVGAQKPDIKVLRDPTPSFRRP